MAKKESFARKEKIELHRIAHYTFFVGLLIAIVTGFFSQILLKQGLINEVIVTLVILGFLVGLFNLTAKETVPFLIACIAIMLAAIINLSFIPGIGIYLRAVLSNIVVFVVPAAILLGLKTIWKLASD